MEIIEIFRRAFAGSNLTRKVRSKVGKNEVRKFGPKFEGKTEIGKRMMKLKSFDLTKESMRLESYN